MRGGERELENPSSHPQLTCSNSRNEFYEKHFFPSLLVPFLNPRTTSKRRECEKFSSSPKKSCLSTADVALALPASHPPALIVKQNKY
jgi:hypothetical protein